MKCPACVREIDDAAVRCPFCTTDIITVTGVGKGTASAAMMGVVAGAGAGIIFSFFLGHWLLNAIVLGSLLGWIGYSKGLTQKRAINKDAIIIGNAINRLNSSANPQVPSTTALGHSNNPSLQIFNGERELTNDAYKIYLTKTYNFEKNEILGKIACEGRLFDNVEHALLHAQKLDKENQKSIVEPPVVEEAPLVVEPVIAPKRVMSEAEKKLAMEELSISHNGSRYIFDGQPFFDLDDAIAFAKKERAKRAG
jgi:hypothetical protein